MIPYSLDTEVRKIVQINLVLLAACITLLSYSIEIPFINTWVENTDFGGVIKLALNVSLPPFMAWSVLNFLYSKIFWKWRLCRACHHVPDLNGTWTGYTVNDKRPNQRRRVTVTIKQDWNNILIRTEMNDTNQNRCCESFCECTLVGIDVASNKIKLKYAYINTLLGAEAYVGYNELQVEEDRIHGQYITTKPTKGIFEINRICV